MNPTDKISPQHSDWDAVLDFARRELKTEPDYPWRSTPDSAVLRHAKTRKWFGLLMNVRRSQLGLPGTGIVPILNVKCEPAMGGSLRMKDGIMPAYHMNHENWLSVLLDGTVEQSLIFSLLEMSFSLTGPRASGAKPGKVRNPHWLIPANPAYYDVEQAFAQSDTILWKQQNRIQVGDMIYLYMAAPCCAVLYQCRAVEVDIPYSHDDGRVRIRRAMKIKLLHRYGEEQFTRETLKEHGVYAVRSPRGVPGSLRRELERIADIDGR